VAVAALHEARWWRAEPDGKILCTLCPRYCRVGDGQPGFCFLRQNRGGAVKPQCRVSRRGTAARWDVVGAAPGATLDTPPKEGGYSRRTEIHHCICEQQD